MSELYAAIKAREGEPGRPPPDPKILLALWLYATLEGVGSARQLDRLCARCGLSLACGGVSVNYHGLSDFRFDHATILDRLLTGSLTALLAEGVVTLEGIAIDGTKVRANAVKGSFRRADKLARLEELAGQLVAQLKAEAQSNPAASENGRQAAQRRGAQGIARRVAAARRALDELRAEKATRANTHKTDKAEKGEIRVSTTVRPRLERGVEMRPSRLMQQPAPRHSRIIPRPLLDPAIRRRREIRSASINARKSWIPSYARKRECRSGKFFRRGPWTPTSAGVTTLLDAIGSDAR